MAEFEIFRKIPRWSRNIIITEKIDGTNAQIYISEDGEFLTGSRKRWITPQDDNYGFSRWAHDHKEELLRLGPGRHYGEWWGQGIQRGYGLTEKRFSLFNVGQWNEENIPSCCHVVPWLFKGTLGPWVVDDVLEHLENTGSLAAPGFMSPEGIIIWHEAGQQFFKKTILNDESPKGNQR